MVKNKPVLSVCMMTYNHEKYIAQAIESVLMQKTKFPFELIIGEDCSNDRTKEIVQQYSCDYPEIIKVKFSERNIGMAKNFVRTFETCRGKYIALLEGDDHWSDCYKLQKQVDFLEKENNYVMCAHNVEIIYEKDVKDKNQRRFNNPVFSAGFEDILDNHFIPTNSLVFRKTMTKCPAWLSDKKMLASDVALELILTCHGKCFYMDDTMAVKRINLGSVTANKGAKKTEFRYNIYKIYLYHNINRYSKFKYEKMIFPRLIKIIARNILVSILSFKISGLFFSLKIFIFAMRDFVKLKLRDRTICNAQYFVA